MSLVPSAVAPAPVAERPPARGGNRVQWLIVGCYLLAAVAVTWRLWADPAARAQAGDTADVDLFAWFMRYDAVAIAHGHLPALFTTAVNAPRGINLMWNTSFLLPGVLLAPVTLLAGPQVSLTIMLTLGLAGSAASLFWVLRRWGASVTAAALGGAVYGFSPALVNSGIGHYHLVFAVLPPLIIDALLRILAGRGSAVRSGAWLGLLAAAQLFTGEELLTETALAALVLVVVLAASHPRAVRDRARDVGFGIGVSVAVVLLICGHALWVQFAGPLTQHNHLTGPDPFTNRLAFFVDPPGNLLLHTPATAAAAAAYSRGLPEYLGYLGWPLLVVLVAATIRYWRDPRVRTVAVLWLALELLSLGGGTLSHGGFQFPGYLLPFHWLQGSPVLSQALPDRLSILADGAAGAVLAFSLDLARRTALAAPAWRRAIPAAVAVLAVLPLVPLPYPAAPAAATPGRLAGGLRPAAARAGRPRARRPGRAAAPHRGDALGGGHRGPRHDDRRLLHRTQQVRAAGDLHPWPGHDRRAVPRRPVGRIAAPRPHAPRAGPSRNRLLAPGRRGRRHQPGLAARALPGQLVRAARLRRGQRARVAVARGRDHGRHARP